MRWTDGLGFLGMMMDNLQKNTEGATLPPVLDACCGSRMFWFDRKDQRATFVDKRRERRTGGRENGNWHFRERSR